AAQPEQRVGEIALLTAEEHHRQLEEWNATRRAYPQDVGLPQLFEAQVARAPDAIALQDAQAQVTYDWLNRRANQLAHALRAEGVGPEVRVGGCLPRSLDLVIAILAILKAAGAYVPLAPEEPAERLAVLLRDARPAVLIGQEAQAARLTALCARLAPEQSPRLRCLPRAWTRLAEQSEANPAPPVELEHPLYVIYTSGSTGQPKGVLG